MGVAIPKRGVIPKKKKNINSKDGPNNDNACMEYKEKQLTHLNYITKLESVVKVYTRANTC
ncbi:17093_t:CDS:2 [Gigaspora margarita]|uniref:17093_t:CDS:1 n=1 Tax=Gigaspora margarita TaxID=4874 RepID=A0ABN7VVU6_GIGMA|nr:17093_t:CDS:2 [Gigaspora margarita]